VIDRNAIAEARRHLGTRLAAHRRAQGYKQQEFAPLVHYSRSTLANVETGRQSGTRSFWLRCDELLAAAGALTAAYDEIQDMVRQQHREAARPPGNPTTHAGNEGRRIPDPVALAAHQSQMFLAQWESRCISRAVVEEFADDLSRLAVDYVSRPLDQVFRELVAVRDRACSLLDERRVMADTRDLMLIAGLACGMLAHASIDLGDRQAAAHQARVASRLATEAGHQSLQSWVLGTQSLIAYCLRLPDKAIDFATRGQVVGSTGTAGVRLAALKARGYAMKRNGPAAKLALTEAEAARDRADGGVDDLEALGGVLTFPVAKQLYYAASTAALVSDGKAAEAFARQAIAAYGAAPEEQRSYGDLALARVCLAQAQLLKPQRQQDLHAAGHALDAVLCLAPEHRIAGLHRPLRRVQTDLNCEPLRHAPEAARLSRCIDGFLAEAPALTGA
jgi:DNA-binding XRE family transcriptional regulator